MIIKIQRHFSQKIPKHLDMKERLAFAWKPIHLQGDILWLGFYYKVFMWNEYEDCWTEHFPRSVSEKRLIKPNEKSKNWWLLD